MTKFEVNAAIATFSSPGLVALHALAEFRGELLLPEIRSFDVQGILLNGMLGTIPLQPASLTAIPA